MTGLHIEPIGVIRSPYKEKFAVPRQPGLVQDGGGELLLLPPYNQAEAVRGLEQFSHIWLLFVFHQTQDGGWRPTVRPPRLGGNSRMGVFATRSTFRPNPIGMSLIELKGIRQEGADIILQLGSLDLVDGTPVVDIKPYLPFAESIPDAQAGFAQLAPDANMPVHFSAEAEQALQNESRTLLHLRRFITQVLAQDPRPAYRKNEQQVREFAVHLMEFNVRWRVENGQATVIAIDKR
ncbi:tRNA (N6-threonylcarbamoyladenosine(37)-N6)-methyltransferase TrmO [Budviciaceae bacterium BWR-B9]|uniref:tRNA (N6-threonylcarbamoyladenosine(37)-N6)-methyltransferase TrmO n=1 Tax=Limnobaculum allomyrinae TaxID=2791986 RepID=A0ABS1ITR7_9GAMM|nr:MULTISPECIES: tRNA (N6-threonylcarbamoyladenosine(37)-N6)-methyltransferase TrmO [Limnobaculum]MBK5144670.1 tRNA (N6-threonylcarbamoyladenosine(37)-N6)-methyltransferase TrmO [Limnobaculum allomyrinae]MBV7692099.1 tRNA (N6-threonylcarbamoyladenosine(37)-N6)-methyltransferase TrmO [Limnobaculum sp. M2-1]